MRPQDRYRGRGCAEIGRFNEDSYVERFFEELLP